MWELLTQPEAWISFLTLSALEIVLGIDNIVFIAILADRLPPELRKRTYRVGLGGALITRIALLLTISWIMGLNKPLFSVIGRAISGRDLVLLIGGAFLLAKSTHEIYNKVENVEHASQDPKSHKGRFISTVIQIMLVDIVFSLDSVITAVGMSNQIPVMIGAVLVAIGVMMIFAQKIGDFVNRHPSMKILALSFLLLIGVLLVAEGLGEHFNKGYIYFAMAFSLSVELINMRVRKKVPGDAPVDPTISATKKLSP